MTTVLCPTLAAANAAAATLTAAARLSYSSWGSLQEIRAVFEDFRGAYKAAAARAVTVTASGEDVAALTAVMAAAKGSAVAAGDVYSMVNTADTTDDVLETAKGSAVVAGDLFRIVSIGPTVVLFLGEKAATAFVALDAALAD